MAARRWLLLLAAIAVAAWLVHAAHAPTGEPIGATVTRVVDGDTLDVRTESGSLVRVRLLGIDTPETKRPGTPVECGGPQASRSLAALAPPGRHVTLERDPTQDRVDRYGRLLAYVRLPGGELLEDAQLHAGWAAPYVFAGRPVRRYAEFTREAALARAAHRGVWARCGGDFHLAAAQPAPRVQP